MTSITLINRSDNTEEFAVFQSALGGLLGNQGAVVSNKAVATPVTGTGQVIRDSPQNKSTCQPCPGWKPVCSPWTLTVLAQYH